jgi:transposase
VDDKRLDAAILGVKEPWSVEQVDLRVAQGEVPIWVALPKATLWSAPSVRARRRSTTTASASGATSDTCQYRTLVHARVPRLACPTHGTRQVRVPWAEEGGRFTALFEALAID